MKVEIIKESQAFDPITFTVTVETADELYSLWYRTVMELKHIDTIRASVVNGRSQVAPMPKVDPNVCRTKSKGAQCDDLFWAVHKVMDHRRLLIEN